MTMDFSLSSDDLNVIVPMFSVMFFGIGLLRFMIYQEDKLRDLERKAKK